MSDSFLDHEDKELEILDHIYSRHDALHQRDLAEIVGLSLGMTNAILKRLAKKGLLTIRKVNNRNIRYIVSPAGVEAIMRRSYRYFTRTLKNVVVYREVIEEFINGLKKQGYSGVMLIGASDLDFVVEHACGRYDLKYCRNEHDAGASTCYLYSESYMPNEEKSNTTDEMSSVFLQDLLLWNR